MKAHGVKNIVFSSSATVYGDPKYLPLDENHPVGGCTNPYGKSKYFIEEMIRDLCKAEKVRSSCKEPGAGTWGVCTPKGAGAGAAQQRCRELQPRLCASLGLERRSPALLQPYRCPRVRHDWRRSSGHPKQPHALRGAGTARLLPWGPCRLAVPAWRGLTALSRACPSVQVAVGRREFLSVFGNDYETIDGTGALLQEGEQRNPLPPAASAARARRPGRALRSPSVPAGVRDYIHVMDLAKGHIAALKKLKENCGCKVPRAGLGLGWALSPGRDEGGPGPPALAEGADVPPSSSCQIYNLGTGTGYSVLQMVHAMEKASGREVGADRSLRGCEHRAGSSCGAPSPPPAPLPASVPPREPPAPTALLSCRSSTRSRAGGREMWPLATPTPS